MQMKNESCQYAYGPHDTRIGPQYCAPLVERVQENNTRMIRVMDQAIRVSHSDT